MADEAIINVWQHIFVFELAILNVLLIWNKQRLYSKIQWIVSPAS